MNMPIIDFEQGQTIINSAQIVDAVQIILVHFQCILQPTTTSPRLGCLFAGCHNKAELMQLLKRIAVVTPKIHEPELFLSSSVQVCSLFNHLRTICNQFNGMAINVPNGFVAVDV